MNDRRHDVLSFGPFDLFAAERVMRKADEPIPLGGRALDILIVNVEETNLRVHISAPRKAVGDGRARD